MAVRGKGYTKTTWTFEERPVASSKLNQWDDRIETALELVYLLLSLAWGGGNGIVRGATDDDLAVSPTNPPGLSTTVAPGVAWIDGLPFRLTDNTETIDVTAPASDPRIDLVLAELETGNVIVVTGTEEADPDPPGVPSGAVPLAELHLRPGMTIIKSTDDGTEGYIVDARRYL
jgi:hypothetical protein